MNSKMIAIILIAVGLVVLAYSGISFKSPGRPIDVGPIHIQTTNRHFIPPAVGILALAGGILLLVMAPKRA